MEKALARNPNLLRTLLGLSFTLILVLGYSVYSATLDSEYYIYDTSLDEENLTLTQTEEGENSMTWTSSSHGPYSWVNFTLTGAPAGATLTVTSGGVKWWSHPMLGSEDAVNFNCLEPNSDFELVNQCEHRFTHSAIVEEDGNVTLHGLLSDQLPLVGKGTIRADNLTAATTEAEDIIFNSNMSATWLIKLHSNDAIDNQTASIETTVVSHQLLDTYQFQLNPIVESIWSLTALMSCFAMILALPLGIYYASRKREQRINKLREVNDESE
jgi:hypothetical protein